MLETFVIQPEHILIPFFRAFFSQTYLYGKIQNQFRYTDGLEDNSLIIQMTDDYDQETPNAIPAIIIQEGGFQEQRRVLGPGRQLWDVGSHHELYKTSFLHPITIHCVTEEKGSAKFLQASLAKAIISFRWALYEYGINDISDIQGFPPTRLDGETTPYMYDCPISFTVQLDSDWRLNRDGNVIDKILIAFTGIFDNITYDDVGELILPEENFEQKVEI